MLMCVRRFIDSRYKILQKIRTISINERRRSSPRIPLDRATVRPLTLCKSPIAPHRMAGINLSEDRGKTMPKNNKTRRIFPRQINVSGGDKRGAVRILRIAHVNRNFPTLRGCANLSGRVSIHVRRLSAVWHHRKIVEVYRPLAGASSIRLRRNAFTCPSEHLANLPRDTRDARTNTHARARARIFFPLSFYLTHASLGAAVLNF